MGLKEVGWEGVDWMHVAEVRGQWRALVNTVMNPSGSVKGGKFLGQLSDCHLLKRDLAA
jgi:hypothetical protein